MSRNRNNSNILSSGVVSRQLANLREEGVAFCKRVSKFLKMEPKAASFLEVVEEGNIDYLNDGFLPKFDQNWTNKGTRVRGELYLVKINGYRRNDLKLALADESKRRGRKIEPATAYELASYAKNGWNKEDTILAFGSVYKDPYRDQFVPSLVRGIKSSLCLTSAEYDFNEHDRVLVVSQ